MVLVTAVAGALGCGEEARPGRIAEPQFELPRHQLKAEPLDSTTLSAGDAAAGLLDGGAARGCGSARVGAAGAPTLGADCGPAPGAQNVITTAYGSECPEGAQVQWGFLTYEAKTPGDSEVIFWMRTAQTEVDLARSEWVELIVARASESTQVCSFFGPAPCPIDLYVMLGGPPLAHQELAEIAVMLTPSSDDDQAPDVLDWQLNYSCTFNQ